MKIYATSLRGETHATAVVLALISMSQWLQVMPLPDDVWEITVREENRALLNRLINATRDS